LNYGLKLRAVDEDIETQAQVEAKKRRVQVTLDQRAKSQSAAARPGRKTAAARPIAEVSDYSGPNVVYANRGEARYAADQQPENESYTDPTRLTRSQANFQPGAS